MDLTGLEKLKKVGNKENKQQTTNKQFLSLVLKLPRQKPNIGAKTANRGSCNRVIQGCQGTPKQKNR